MVQPDLPSPAHRVLPVDAVRRRLASAIFGASLAWPLVGAADAAETRSRRSRAMMGTQVDIVVESTDAPLQRAAVELAFVEMGRLVARMSHYQATSDVGAIHLASGIQPVPVAPELMTVLRMAQAMSRRSSGAFDVTVGALGLWDGAAHPPRPPEPRQLASRLAMVDHRQLVLDESAGTAFLARRGMRVDLGGIAKLPILAAGMKVLQQHGLRHALINGGGDVLATPRAGGRPWRVGIRDPHQPARLLATLDLHRGWVVSSGDYERFVEHDGRRHHHVLDPRTGQSSRGVHGVTLVADEIEAVNGLGTALMVLGAPAARELIRHSTGVEALLTGSDQPLWVTPGLARRLARPPGSAMS